MIIFLYVPPVQFLDASVSCLIVKRDMNWIKEHTYENKSLIARDSVSSQMLSQLLRESLNGRKNGKWFRKE